MPPIDQLAKSRSIKMLYLGHSGCLAADTVVTTKRGEKIKKLTMQELWVTWEKPRGVKGVRGKRHSPTKLLADLGGYVGFNNMVNVVKSGRKMVYGVWTNSRRVYATADHEFLTENGWKTLKEISEGERVWTWRESRKKDEHVRGPGKGSTNKDRVVIYSVPYHPFGIRNFVAGRDYKRVMRSRAVVEAAMNGLQLEQFIRVVRQEPERAATLQYLSNTVDVHHLDGDVTNDDLDNLSVLERKEHIEEHQAEKVQASKKLELEEIVKISEYKELETFDVAMAEPYRNFIADGFVVHNSGKTGSTAALAAAGYNVRLLDLDKGAEIVIDYLVNPASPYRQARPGLWTREQAEGAAKRYSVVALDEDVTTNSKGDILPKGKLWERVTGQLTKWTDGAEDLGNIDSWTPNDVLVIDGLSRLAQASFNRTLALNGRIGGRPEQSDYNLAQLAIEKLLMLLYADQIKCNVILVCHIAPIELEGEATKGFPQTIGKALAPKIGQYFNHALLAQTSGQGSGIKRVIKTNTSGMVQLKSAAPLRVKPEYDLAFGLAEYFRDVKGEGGGK